MIGLAQFLLCLALTACSLLPGALPTACALSASPRFETRDVFNDEAGNRSDADDPAIWVNAANPRRSLVIGTLKRGGLDVYDLNGSLLQHIPADAMPSDMQLRNARYNNVDILYGLKLGKRATDLAVVTDRHNDLLRFFAIDPDALEAGGAPLTEVTSPGAPRIFTADIAELKAGRTAYGLAVAQIEPGREKGLAFVSRSGRTTVARASIFPDQGRVAYSVAAQFDLPDRLPLPGGETWSPCQDEEDDRPHVEGMVVDDFHRVLYLAQERVGIWKIALDPPSIQPALLDRVKSFGLPHQRVLHPEKHKLICQPEWNKGPALGSDYLSPDVEGLTIYDMGQGKGYLLASSQGASEFVVYDRVNGATIGTFAIAGGLVDGSEQCDGAHVVSASLGAELDDGLLVVQDGCNTPQTTAPDGRARDSTNFKFVRWADVARNLGLAVRHRF
jgi:3-phytase